MKLKSLLIFFTLVLLTAGCEEQVNQEFTGEDGEPRLLGKINKEGLGQEPYSDWFKPAYEAYEPDTTLAGELRNALDDYKIEVFMGTWCSDSQREVPQLIRLLETIDFPPEQFEIIAIDDAEAQYKQSPQGQEKGKNIHHVPTVIFLKDGKEINRIVEYPRETLEADIVKILKGAYTPYYNTANQVDKRLNAEGLETFVNDLDKLAGVYKGGPDNYYELNTYSKVLFYSGKQDAAIAVARLNAKLFPEEAYAHAALAKRLHDAGQDGEALQHIQLALELEPEDMEIQDLLSEIESAE